MSVVMYSSKHLKCAIGVGLMACTLTALLTWQLTRHSAVVHKERTQVSLSCILFSLAMGSTATIILQWMLCKCCRKSCQTSFPSNSSVLTNSATTKRLYNRQHPGGSSSPQSRINEEYYRTHTAIDRGLSALYGRPRNDSVRGILD